MKAYHSNSFFDLLSKLKISLEATFPFTSEDPEFPFFPVSNDESFPEIIKIHGNLKKQNITQNSAAILVGESHFMKTIINMPENILIFLDNDPSPKRNILNQIELANKCSTNEEFIQKINFDAIAENNWREYHLYDLNGQPSIFSATAE